MTEYKRKYTTKKIMEMTNLDKLQKEAAAKAQELLKESAAKSAQAAESSKLSEPIVPKDVSVPEAEIVQAPEEAAAVHQEPVQFNAVAHLRPSVELNAAEEPKAGLFSGFSVFILLFPTLYLMLIFSLPEQWMNTVADNLNGFILWGSFFVLNLFQVPSTIDGSALSGANFKVLLGGDLVAFYSIVLLGAFTLLYVYVQKTTWIRKCIIFASFVPLAVGANITRIVLTVGLAVNSGVQSADQYVHGFLESLVYIITIVSVIVLTILLRTDETEF